MELRSESVSGSRPRSHLYGRRLCPAHATEHRSPSSRHERPRRLQNARWEVVMEAAAMLFGCAVFYAVAWGLAVLVQ